MRVYGEDVSQWLAWCEGRGLDFLTIGRADMRAYADCLKAKGNGTATLKRRLGGARRWYTWLWQEGITPDDRLQGYRMPRNGSRRRLPKVLTTDQAAAVLDALPGDSSIRVRDRAILATLYGSGLRVAEPVALDLEDVDMNDRLLHVLDGKGGRERVAVFSEDAAVRCGST